MIDDDERRKKLATLSSRQRQVLALICKGITSNTEIAEALGFKSQRAIQHRQRITAILGNPLDYCHLLDTQEPLAIDLEDEDDEDDTDEAVVKPDKVDYPEPEKMVAPWSRPFHWLVAQDPRAHLAALVAAPAVLVGLVIALVWAASRPVEVRQVTVAAPPAPVPPTPTLVVVVTLVPVVVAPAVQPTQPPATTVPTQVPTAVPTVPPTPKPSPTSVLIAGVKAIGETWTGSGLNLTLKQAPYNNNTVDCTVSLCTYLTFVVENKTPDILDFATAASAFYLQTSTGQRFESSNPVNFPGLDHQPKEFTVYMHSISLLRWQTIITAPDVDYYVVGVKGFSTNIKEAQWRQDIRH